MDFYLPFEVAHYQPHIFDQKGKRTIILGHLKKERGTIILGRREYHQRITFIREGEMDSRAHHTCFEFQIMLIKDQLGLL